MQHMVGTDIACDSLLIEVRDLVVSLAGRRVHDDLSMAVHPGEVVVIAGDNGSGKTTLLRALLGEVASSGVIELLGEPAPLSAAKLSGLGAFVGEPALLPWMRPKQFLTMLLDTAGEPDDGRADTALQRVGFPGARHRTRIRKLSQGEQQLVAIAAAVLRSPRLLILDEPFSHLDRSHVEIVTELIADVRAKAGAVVFTAHRRAEAAQADRVLVLDEARLHEVDIDSELARGVLK